MKAQFFPYKDENVTRGVQHVTIGLILLNTLIFLISLSDFENIILTYGFTPASFTVITIFTSMFLHGGFDHLFGNMWYLYLFGDNVEEKFGSLWYLLFYLCSGVFAILIQWLTDPLSTVPTIGASGAISGILGAYIVLFPKVKVRVIGPFYTTYKVSAMLMIGFWFIMQLMFGAISFVGGTGSGIAFWAHVGGFVFGFITTKIYKRFRSHDKDRLLRLGIFEN